MKYSYTLFIVLGFSICFAQQQDLKLNVNTKDSTFVNQNNGISGINNQIDNRQSRKQKRAKKRENLTVQDYKTISYGRDTTFVDTTQSIFKDYKHNYLRKDDFDLH